MTLPDFDPTPVYVVLGASGGIGSALIRRLARAGGRVVLAARHLERLQPLAEEVNGHALSVDATSFEQVEQCLARAVELHGRVDGVACCVGSILLKAAHQTSFDEFSATVTTNLTSAFATVRAAGKLMTQGGSVVLCSSAAARIGLANHEAIAAAKAGIIGLVLSAAATYAPRNLRFNAVAPGLVRTPLAARITSSESALKASTAMHPLGRIGEPGDVASAIEWLLHPCQNWITGQVLGVDGGLAEIKSRP